MEVKWFFKMRWCNKYNLPAANPKFWSLAEEAWKRYKKTGNIPTFHEVINLT